MEFAEVALLIALCPPLINCHCAVNVIDARQVAELTYLWLSLCEILEKDNFAAFFGELEMRCVYIMNEHSVLTGSYSALCKKF